MKKKIFVYGTLRKGMYNYDMYLKDEDSFRGFGYVEGSLFTIIGSDYPAFLQEGHDMILGEIHEIDEKTAVLIDDLEGYRGEDDKNNEYNKVICDIYNENQEVIDQIPVYVFNMEKHSNVRLLGEFIKCCDYVRYSINIEQERKSLFPSHDDEDE